MRPIARWNPARDVWEVPETDNLLCEHLDVFWETFPTSGMTVAGTAYELPTSAPLTDGSACSLLPTPVTQPDTGNGHARNLGKEVRLLPTPAVADGTGGHKTRSGDRSGELLLPGVALSFPPRPAATPTEPDSTGTEG